jgi:hypothetical protein
MCSARKVLRSKKIGELLQICHGCDQPLLGQDRQILVNALRRVLKARPNFAERGAHQTGRERQLVPEKLVGVLGLDAERRKCLWWEVLQVLGYMASHLPMIAAARTCRSSGSGNVRAGTKAS